LSAYNVQTAVDLQHHLIVSHEVVTVGHDRTQLAHMATRAKEAMGQQITVLADRGYFKGEEILRCSEDGIVPLVPKPQTSNNKAAGLFDRSDFVYVQRDDEYVCPAGKRAIHRLTRVEGTNASQVLVIHLSTVSAEAQMHHRQESSHYALGA